MPFSTLSHKASKTRFKKPSPLELTNHPVQTSLPTPPLTGDSMAPNAGFKIFSWKKKPSFEPRPISEPPRPILRTHPDQGSSANIRFAPKGPAAVVSQYNEVCLASPRALLRRSSRPASPSASSFGARGRNELPLHTPPLHVTTPPTAYVSTLQSRAPPPPSPFRATHERQRSRTLPETLPLSGMPDFAPRPPRNASLFPASGSTSTLSESAVPMLNIIPATPQDSADEFAKPRSNRFSKPLANIVQYELDDIPLDPPYISVDLDFSPFDPSVSLPEDVPPHPLPPSPPFDSYPSLPSLSSESSITTSSSMSSVVSFPDVEEALGSMLASLSEKVNHGLGLGLDLPVQTSMTAPLTPRRRPPPLDLSNLTQTHDEPSPRINHRIAFYGTAKAHPNSPTSGIFTAEFSNRDSMSLASEASDDDLQTASIISLTPVLGDRALMVEVREEYVEVGLAL
ncbi:hypothetical protein P7C73_g259, partial [Tremellales sp. Uapishka_1]